VETSELIMTQPVSPAVLIGFGMMKNLGDKAVSQ
jgi:hypothetical protein